MKTLASINQKVENTPTHMFVRAHSRKVPEGENAPLVSSFSTPMIQHKASCACGGGCPACQNRLPLQAKLKIGQPNDEYEQEADRVADQIMRMPNPQIQMKSG